MQGVLDFIKDNWIIIAVIGVLALSTGRLVINNPKYSMKQIAKNPLLIFKLFAQAVENTVEDIGDIVDIVEDLSDVVGPAIGTNSNLGKKIKSVSDIAEDVKKVTDTIEKAGNIAEDIDEAIEKAKE